MTKIISLKNLHEATEQEVFDQVAKHLLTQKVKAVNEHGDCVYFGKQNTKCAGGCLILDEEYNPKFEGETWCSLVASGYVPKENFELIKNLQCVHDNSEIENWSSALEIVARDHKLNFNKLDILGIE